MQNLDTMRIADVDDRQSAEILARDILAVFGDRNHQLNENATMLVAALYRLTESNGGTIAQTHSYAKAYADRKMV